MFFKNTFIILCIIFYSLIIGPIIIFFSLFNPYSNIVYILSSFWAKLILITVGVKVKITGIENIPKNINFIIISNHQSHFDVLALMSRLPFQIRFTAKKELFKIPIFGWVMSITGHIEIDRTDREKSIEILEKTKKKIKEKNFKVLFFPEGGRSRDGKLRPFKKGAAIFSIQTQLPVLPITIIGSRNILPPDTLNFNKGTIELIISPIIEVKDYSFDDRDKLNQKFYEIISQNLNK